MPGKRNNLNNSEKLKIINAVESNNAKPASSKRKLLDIAAEFGIKPSTLSTFIKDKEKIISRSLNSDFSPSTKRFRGSDKYTDVDKALLQWFTSCRTSYIPISDEILNTKANFFAKKCGVEETICHSWIQRWKLRHNISSKIICGESGSVNDNVVDEWKQITLPIILSQYAPCDIFNCDETGLFWKLTPHRTLAFKNESCHGGKHSKDRISILVGANMLGEKLPLLVIGKSAHPRVFRNEHVPLEYKSNKKAWMTSVLFEEYVYKLDRRMALQSRRIALFIDNCPSHPKIRNLSAITLVYFPQNTTSKTQPMDCGVIHSLKSLYRKELMLNLLISYDDKKDFKPNLLQSLHWLSRAWENVSISTIINCFHSAGFESTTKLSSPVIAPPIEDFRNIFENILHLFSIKNTVSVDEFIHIDDNVLTYEPTCDEDIVMSIKSGKNDYNEDSEEQVDDEVVEIAPNPSEAIKLLEKIRLTLLKYSNCSVDFQNINNLHSALTQLAVSCLTQTTLDNYFIIKNQ